MGNMGSQKQSEMEGSGGPARLCACPGNSSLLCHPGVPRQRALQPPPGAHQSSMSRPSLTQGRRQSGAPGAGIGAPQSSPRTPGVPSVTAEPGLPGVPRGAALPVPRERPHSGAQGGSGPALPAPLPRSVCRAPRAEPPPARAADPGPPRSGDPQGGAPAAPTAPGTLGAPDPSEPLGP